MLERQYKAVPVTLVASLQNRRRFSTASDLLAPEVRASARKSTFARKARLSTFCSPKFGGHSREALARWRWHRPRLRNGWSRRAEVALIQVNVHRRAQLFDFLFQIGRASWRERGEI